jgi:hypothetical protein
MALAFAGDAKLFRKYYDANLFSQGDIAKWAGIGGCKEICDIFLKTKFYVSSVCEGIAESEKSENIDILDGEYEWLEWCLNYLAMRIHLKSAQRMMLYIQEKYPDFDKWLKRKRIKKNNGF